MNRLLKTALCLSLGATVLTSCTPPDARITRTLILDAKIDNMDCFAKELAAMSYDNIGRMSDGSFGLSYTIDDREFDINLQTITLALQPSGNDQTELTHSVNFHHKKNCPDVRRSSLYLKSIEDKIFDSCGWQKVGLVDRDHSCYKPVS